MIGTDSSKGGPQYGISGSPKSVQNLRQRGQSSDRPGPRLSDHCEGGIYRHHRLLRLRQIHAASHHCRGRHPDQRDGFPQRAGRVRPKQTAAGHFPPAAGGNDLPVSQPHPHPERGGEHHPAHPDGSQEGQPGTAGGAADPPGPPGPQRPPAQPALRRAAAAGGHRPGADEFSRCHAGG